MELRIALIGFGNVGQGFAEILSERSETLRRRYRADMKVVAISDLKWGSIWVESGLDLRRVLSLVRRGESLDKYPGGHKGMSSIEVIKETNSNVVVEVTWTNINSGEPGITHIMTALKKGKHVVTTNKGPIAIAYKELMRMAEKSGVMLRFEGTVMSGTPAISTALQALAGCEIEEIYGVLNGTTNFILTQMEAGSTFEEALKKAQDLGYAEADPSMDIDGWDSAVKAVILAKAIMDADLKLRDVKPTGIREMSVDEVRSALKEGKKIKLVARVRRDGEMVRVSVKPEKLDAGHPLSGVSGVLNAVTFRTDNLNEITLIGPGAGRRETGQAILSDLLMINWSLSRRS